MNTMNHNDILRELELNDAPPSNVAPMEKTASASLVDEIRSYTAAGITKEASVQQPSLLDVIDHLEKSAGISSPYAEQFIKQAQAMGASDEQIVRVLEERHHELMDKAAQGFLGGIKNMLANAVPRSLSKNRSIGAGFGKAVEGLQKAKLGKDVALSQIIGGLDDAAMNMKHIKNPGWFKRMAPGFDFRKYQSSQIDTAASKLYKRLRAAERAGVDADDLLGIYHQLGGATKGGVKRMRHPELQSWMKEMQDALKGLEASSAPGQFGILGEVPGKGVAMAKKHPLATAGLLGAGGYVAGDYGDGDGSGSGSKVVVL